MKYLFVFLFTLQIISCGSKTKPFNPDGWKNWRETENTLFDRWDMANDLIRTDELMMFDKVEIIELLGEPNSNIQTRISYFLGHTRTGINAGQLTIEFDENNKVLDFIITEG